MKVSESLVQYVLIIHEVVDYPVWKKIFDNAANIRKQAGEISYQVLRYQNIKLIAGLRPATFLVAGLLEHGCKRFFESPKLVQIRAEAGVKSPDFIYLEQIESGTL